MFRFPHNRAHLLIISHFNLKGFNVVQSLGLGTIWCSKKLEILVFTILEQPPKGGMFG